MFFSEIFDVPSLHSGHVMSGKGTNILKLLYLPTIRMKFLNFLLSKEIDIRKQ